MSSSAPAAQAPPQRHGSLDPDGVVELRGVSRRFGDVAALEDIDVTVRPGEIYGLVGPSGCGKTTLVRLVVGLLLPTQGEVRVRGVDPKRFRPADRHAIGYLPQQFSLYPTLTVQENARFVAGLYGIGWLQRRRRVREVLEFLEIWDARGRLARDVSGGMQRRLALAAALLHEPSLLVVDEPTAGLDPALRERIWRYLREVQDAGTTVIVTTQYMDEAERCDSVGVMRGGRLVAQGRPDSLRQRASVPDLIEVEVEALEGEDVEALWRLPGVRGVRRLTEDRLRITSDESERTMPAVSEEFARRGKRVRTIDVERASFEDVFLALVERS